MSVIPLIQAPHPIFKQKSEPVKEVSPSIQELMDDLVDTMHAYEGIGIAAPMVGILKQIIAVDMRDAGGELLQMANPVITWKSSEMQRFMEGSLCYPGINTEIERPNAIKVEYLDRQGQKQTLDADGFLATVLQHEIDYLHGVVFLDYLSFTKRSMLLKKMKKFAKLEAAHVHGPHCNH